jgi:hypothetical protein
MRETKDSFFARWSRRKARERDVGQAAVPDGTVAPADAELPSLESLTPESDFSAFMRPDVDPALRRQALGKLFGDPRFNTLDGLDTYIDDYTRADPLPTGMLEKLVQWQNILAAQQPQTQTPALEASTDPAASGVAENPLQLENDLAVAPACEPSLADAEAPVPEPESRRG